MTLDYSQIFLSLSNPLRIKIFETLRLHKICSVVRISELVGISSTLASYHVGIMERSGVLVGVKSGRFKMFSISFPTTSLLTNFFSFKLEVINEII